jgi:hypothetical protein
MAHRKVYAPLDTAVTLGNSGGWKSLIAFQAPANIAQIIDSWGVYPQGQVNSDKGIAIRLILGSTMGTGAAGTLVKRGGYAETPQGTLTIAPFSVEPTPSGKALDGKTAHPQGAGDWPTIERGAIILPGSAIILVQYQNDSGGAGIPAFADLAFEQ